LQDANQFECQLGEVAATTLGIAWIDSSSEWLKLPRRCEEVE
jgi:hypothetical protein